MSRDVAADADADAAVVRSWDVGPWEKVASSAYERMLEIGYAPAMAKEYVNRAIADRRWGGVTAFYSENDFLPHVDTRSVYQRLEDLTERGLAKR